MVVLRSREVFPAKPEPTTNPLPKSATPEPSTPAQTREPLSNSVTMGPETPESDPDFHSSRRRSLRLSSKSARADGSTHGGRRKRNNVAIEAEKERVEESISQIGNEGKLIDNVTERDLNPLKSSLSLRSGKRVVKRRMEENGYDKEIIEREGDGKEKDSDVVENRSDMIAREEMIDNFIDNEDRERIVEAAKGTRGEEGIFVIEKSRDGQGASDIGTSMRKRRYAKEEKGKEKLVVDSSVLNGDNVIALDMQSKVTDLVNSLAESAPSPQLEVQRPARRENTGESETRMGQFRQIARQNASRFAHFEHQEQEEELLPHEVDAEMQSVEESQEVEDWPGPFSTAMKIIRDRANKQKLQQGTSSSEKAKSVPITWIPRKNGDCTCLKASIPSLQELCIRILVKNADAITSLDSVPDALRHKLCQLLCNSRKMNSRFLDLLCRGSPTEIRIKDCSWLTEEEFTKYFEGCDTSSLVVLQLDQCGRCMPDYTLLATLARSSCSLPALTTLSLSGACRLSDAGILALVSSAPALRSINLSQCSLLTSTSICNLAESLGSVLQELYINDCLNIDPISILPALSKLEKLQVLSLAGMATVCDDFIRELVSACGHTLKELVLTDCMKLTDYSMRVIAETCSGLCVLDLFNLRKLTDSTLGYLANGCREIQTLKLSRNAFSDEGIAAFVEASGEPLKELSLNNIKNVGNNTALSLARRARNLRNLDLSWCRSVTDEALGLIVDDCSSLKLLKLFGCDQITRKFLDGHSNQQVQIIGLKLSPLLDHLWEPDQDEFPLRYY